MHLMGKLEMHATDLANRYLNHNARLKMEEEEARLHPQVRTDLLGGHKKRKTRHIKRQSIWGPSEEKRFEYTASPIHISTRHHQVKQGSVSQGLNQDDSTTMLPPLTLEEKAEALLSKSLPMALNDLDRPMSVSHSRKHIYSRCVN